jgi:hypothetical protein
MPILTFIGGCVVVALLGMGIYWLAGWVGQRSKRNKLANKENNGE